VGTGDVFLEMKVIVGGGEQGNGAVSASHNNVLLTWPASSSSLFGLVEVQPWLGSKAPHFAQIARGLS
jgi:hypothetical protein